MKKLMFAAAACALAGAASAAIDLSAVKVYDYKASVKHTYLKESSIKKIVKDKTVNKVVPEGLKLYIKYTKTSSLKGYLIQDEAGRLGATNVNYRTCDKDEGGMFVHRITLNDPQPGNRCFLVVQNNSAEKAYRIPRIIPGVLDAKWYDPKMNGSTSTPAQGYLYLGGEIAMRSGAIDPTLEGTPYGYDGFYGTTFAPERDFLGANSESTYSNEYYCVDENGDYFDYRSIGRKFWENQREPIAYNSRESMERHGPWEWVPGVRTATFGIDDYFFTSCYLFGQYNQPTWYGTQDGSVMIQEFADCWLNGAGIGKAQFVKGAGTACCGKAIVTRQASFTLASLAGNLKAGIFLCTENGEDNAHSMDFDRTGLFEDQFWQSIEPNSYRTFALEEGKAVYAWYRHSNLAGPDVTSYNFMVKQDIWADGALDLRTTDVGYGTWSIKYNKNFKGGLKADVIDTLESEAKAIPYWGFATPTTNAKAGTAPLMAAIKIAQYKLNKDASLFGDPIDETSEQGMINFSFYWNYLAEGYNAGWVNPLVDDES